MNGKEIHERSREILIEINDLFNALIDRDQIDKDDLKAIDLNADQIQNIAEDIRHWAMTGEKIEGQIEPQ